MAAPHGAGRNGPPARPTIRDVAARAGVSKSLVSLALQNAPRVAPETREAILAAAEELGYRRNAAARALVAHRTRTVGVFVLDLHNPVTADVLDAVQAEARRRDYRTIVVVGGEDAAAEHAELEKLLEFRVEGIVALGHRLPDGAEQAFTADCPAVIIGSEHHGIPHLAS
ncbi:MAG TPA: LacI family DNA-binding transcriptional regulator, partial [Phycicoccus sp.]